MCRDNIEQAQRNNKHAMGPAARSMRSAPPSRHRQNQGERQEVQEEDTGGKDTDQDGIEDNADDQDKAGQMKLALGCWEDDSALAS